MAPMNTTPRVIRVLGARTPVFSPCLLGGGPVGRCAASEEVRRLTEACRVCEGLTCCFIRKLTKLLYPRSVPNCPRQAILKWQAVEAIESCTQWPESSFMMSS